MRLLLHHPGVDRVGSPFEQALAALADSGELRIACPYISLGLLELTLSRVDRWKLLTDLEAWLTIVPVAADRKLLAQWWKNHRHAVRHQSMLHAKIFVGRGVAMLGSANCTVAGFCRRVEAGIWLDEPDAIAELGAWFESAWQSAAELDEATIDAAVTSVTTTVVRPSSISRPLLLANAPPKHTRRLIIVGSKKSTVPATSEDDSDPAYGLAADRIADCLRRFCDRPWAETYFDWLGGLIEAVGVPEDDPQFTTTLIKKDRGIGVNVNNRSSLAWDKHHAKGGRSVYYLLSAAYADDLAARVPDAVERIHRLHSYPNELSPPVLLIAPFPPPAEFGNDFRQVLFEAARAEIARGRWPSPQGVRRHVPLLYTMGTDRSARADVLNHAFGSEVVL